MADEKVHPMLEHLAEIRAAQKSARHLAQYLDGQVEEWENSMIRMGIPVPAAPADETPGPDLQDGGRQERTGHGAEEAPATIRAPRASSAVDSEGQEDADGEPKQCRLEQLRMIGENQMTPEEREEWKMLESIDACSTHAGMLGVIARSKGNRLLVNEAALLIKAAGRSTMKARPLGNQLRYNVMGKDPAHWRIGSNKNDVESFPNGDALEAKLDGGTNGRDESPNGKPDDRNTRIRMMPLESRTPQS